MRKSTLKKPTLGDFLQVEKDTKATLGGRKKAGGAVVGCSRRGAINVTVTRCHSSPVVKIAAASVALDEEEPRATAEDGTRSFLDLAPGSYTVRVKPPSGDEYDPVTAQQKVHVVAGETTQVAICLTPRMIHMHLDTQRTGVVSRDWEQPEAWSWGPDGRGAIILCNNDANRVRPTPQQRLKPGGHIRKLDADVRAEGFLLGVLDPSKHSDNCDDVINALNDRLEIAPLVLRLHSMCPPPNTWTATLEVSEAARQHIRIFDGVAEGAKEIIGPKTGKSYKLPDFSAYSLQTPDLTFGMEGLKYPEGAFDGLIELTFTLEDGDGTIITRETGWVRVAPWMIPNHTDEADVVFVARPISNDNAALREELKGLVTAAGCQLEVVPAEKDRWLQDCMEIGYSCRPNGEKHGIRAVLRAPRLGKDDDDDDLKLNRYPAKLFSRDDDDDNAKSYVASTRLRNADIGFHQVGVDANSTYNSFGNLEVTPPVTTRAGKHYPWGRIYYYSGVADRGLMDADVRAFLQNQVVQKPFEVDASWLCVGHVDELISFVPDGEGKFKLLIVSPRLAYEILDELAGRGATMLQGRECPVTVTEAEETKKIAVGIEVSVDDLLGVGLQALIAKDVEGATAAELRRVNCAVLQPKITALIEDTLKPELGITDDDIIEVPCLFIESSEKPGYYDSLNANMVNMLVINDRCIIPAPFGPAIGAVAAVHTDDLFAKHVHDALAELGVTPHFIDTWDTYHVRCGGIHCGTNTLRKTTYAKWWEFEP